MAVGTIADAVVKSDFAHSGLIEGVAQNLNAFNEASNGAIVLDDPINKPGYNADNIYFGTFEDFATRQDVATGGDLGSDDINNIVDVQEREVKLNRMIVVQQDDQFFKKGASGLQGGADELRVNLERGFVQAALKKQVNDAISAGVAALRSQSTLVRDEVTLGSPTGYTASALNATLALAKDQRADIESAGVLVMGSETYRQVTEDNLGRVVANVGGLVLREGVRSTYGVPVLVTSAPGLTATDIVGSAGTAAEYMVMCLKPGAIRVTMTEAYDFQINPVTGKVNKTYEMAGRWAHNVRVKGFSWKTASADNPTDVQLQTPTAWELKSTKAEMAAGTLLIHS